MSMFTNAKNVQINGGEFYIARNTQGETGIDVLREASVSAAAVDSEASEYAPRCFPGTREQHISDITDWAIGINSEQTQLMLWMWGPAGVGKSALAQTCAEKVQELDQLGAAFFFSINGRTDHRPFFVTLAYQLSTVLPQYRQILDTIVSRDKTLVTKNMSAQFDSLIVRPMQDLEKQGASVGQKAIFIDGLDECANRDAQVKIIQLIAASVRDKSTPLRWAIFSRAETHILSTFEHERISPITRIIELPIRSPDDDREIELYLRHEFANILRRRKLPLSPSWPADGDIKALVKTAAGLFAYAAAVLRFIDLSTSLRLEDPLQDVLDSASEAGSDPFAGLDAFYMLIMQRIPKKILCNAQLLMTRMVLFTFGDVETRGLAHNFNLLGLSQSELLGIHQYLHAVLKFQEPKVPLVLGDDFDSARPFSDQDKSFLLLRDQVLGVHGYLDFYHKSFYDFLCDPVRSLSFCVTAPAMIETLFDHLIQRHHNLAQNYVIQGTKLVLAPSLERFYTVISWPEGREIVDSYLALWAFFGASFMLCHDGFEMLVRFMEDASPGSLYRLGELDYRKFLLASLTSWGYDLFEDIPICGSYGAQRVIDIALFQCIASDAFTDFDPEAFLKMIETLERLKVVKPYHPRLPSALAPIPYTFSRRKPSGKRSGLHQLGHGQKSVIWYWEFDTEKEYFHDFRTVNFKGAMKMYERSKFEMWDEKWKRPSD